MDGAPLDIGGGHFLDVRNGRVNEFLFRFLPRDEWGLFIRDSVIHYKGAYIGHPFESHIWQLGVEEQVDFLESISKAGCVQGAAPPEGFVEWIQWKLGQKLAEEYMLPYNQKMFGDGLDQLGTYWLEKLPDVSFRETLKSCLAGQAYGRQPGHTRFFYPKRYGYGEVWLRMADAVKGHMRYRARVKELSVSRRRVVCADGEAYEGEAIISTIPWNGMELADAPDWAREGIKKLKHTQIQVEYFPEDKDCKAHWIYEPDARASFHRILCRHNFCPGSHGYWTETNVDRLSLQTGKGIYRHLNHYAYPLNTVGKPEFMGRFLAAMGESRIYGLGRWGEHRHFNSDVVVERSMGFCEGLLNKPGFLRLRDRGDIQH